MHCDILYWWHVHYPENNFLVVCAVPQLLLLLLLCICNPVLNGIHYMCIYVCSTDGLTLILILLVIATLNPVAIGKIEYKYIFYFSFFPQQRIKFIYMSNWWGVGVDLIHKLLCNAMLRNSEKWRGSWCRCFVLLTIILKDVEWTTMALAPHVILLSLKHVFHITCVSVYMYVEFNESERLKMFPSTLAYDSSCHSMAVDLKAHLLLANCATTRSCTNLLSFIRWPFECKYRQ